MRNFLSILTLVLFQISEDINIYSLNKIHLCSVYHELKSATGTNNLHSQVKTDKWLLTSFQTQLPTREESRE